MCVCAAASAPWHRAQELKSLDKAMKDPKFRELLAEYAQELSDPANKKKYEEEIREMESRAGNDVKFVNPEPGFVVKTVELNSKKKTFVNICESDSIEEPVEKVVVQDGRKGTNWSVPHSTTTHRDDTDKKGDMCIVYDVVFHPKALRLAAADAQGRFRNMIISTALSGIEQRFPIHKMQRDGLKFPKLKYKGMAQRSMIRNSKDTGESIAKDELGNSAIKKLHETFNSEHKETFEEAAKAKKKTTTASMRQEKPANEPKYKIVHRGEFDLMDYRNSADKKPNTGRPKELFISIELPLCKSARKVDLDVAEQHISLHCTEVGPYHLDLDLPYPVNEGAGVAKFDKSKKALNITLPVRPYVNPKPAADDAAHAAVAAEPEQPVAAEPEQPDAAVVDAAVEDAVDAAMAAMAEGDPELAAATQAVDEARRQEETAAAASAPAADLPPHPWAASPATPAPPPPAAEKARETLEASGGGGDDDGGPKIEEIAADDDAAAADEPQATAEAAGGEPGAESGGGDASPNPAPGPRSEMPPFVFHQTPGEVSIVVEVVGIKEDTVDVGFVGHTFYGIVTHSLTIAFADAADAHSLHLRFDGALKEDIYTCDVQDGNMVIVVTKDESMTWKRLRAGTGPDNLAECLFPVEERTVAEALSHEGDVGAADGWESAAKAVRADVTKQTISDLDVDVTATQPPAPPSASASASIDDIDDAEVSFYPSDTYTGRREGYAFYQGAKGLGYHLDTYGNKLKAKAGQKQVRFSPPKPEVDSTPTVASNLKSMFAHQPGVAAGAAKVAPGPDSGAMVDAEGSLFVPARIAGADKGTGAAASDVASDVADTGRLPSGASVAGGGCGGGEDVAAALAAKRAPAEAGEDAAAAGSAEGEPQVFVHGQGDVTGEAEGTKDYDQYSGVERARLKIYDDCMAEQKEQQAAEAAKEAELAAEGGAPTLEPTYRGDTAAYLHNSFIDELE